MGKNIPDMTPEQVEFINNLGLPFIVTGKAEDIDAMSIDDYELMHDTILGHLASFGFVDDNTINDTGRMAESIMDYFGDYF